MVENYKMAGHCVNNDTTVYPYNLGYSTAYAAFKFSRFPGTPHVQ